MGLLVRLCIAASIVLLARVPADAACTCSTFPKFDEVAPTADAVLVVEVVQIGPPSPFTMLAGDPLSVTVKVLWVGKGEVGERVRIWNEMAGSSCGGAFRGARVGDKLAIATSKTRVPGGGTETELMTIQGIRPSPGDLSALTGCGEGLVALRTEQQLKRYIGRRYR